MYRFVLFSMLFLLAAAAVPVFSGAPGWASPGKYVVYMEYYSYSYTSPSYSYSVTVYGRVEYSVLDYNNTHVYAQRRVLDTNDTSGHVYVNGSVSSKWVRWDEGFITIEDTNISIRFYIPPGELGGNYEVSGSYIGGDGETYTYRARYDEATGLLISYTINMTSDSGEASTRMVITGKAVESNIIGAGGELGEGDQGGGESGGSSNNTGGGAGGSADIGVPGGASGGGTGQQAGSSGSTDQQAGGNNSNAQESTGGGGSIGGNAVLVAGVAAAIAVGAAVLYLFTRRG